MAQDFDHIHLPPEISIIVKGATEDGVGAFDSTSKSNALFGRTTTGIRRAKVRTQ